MMLKLCAAIAILGLQFYTLHYLRAEVVIPERPTFAEFPREIDDWRCLEPETLPDDILDKLQATDYLSCVFVPETSRGSRSGEGETAESGPVHLYVGYHAHQATSGARGGAAAIHPPEHCLPGSGWDIIDAEVVPVAVNGRQGEAKRFLIAKGNQRNLVVFWYQSRGRVVANNHEKILYTFMDRALHGRTDGALVRMTVALQNENTEQAARRVAAFVEDVTPELDRYLPE